MTLMRLPFPTLPDDFFNFTVGFDRDFNELFGIVDQVKMQTKYPPHNIREVSDNEYAIEMAVAGFAPSDIVVSLENRTLQIVGKQPEQDDTRKYMHRGLAMRSFEKTFTLAEHVQVRSVSVEHGMLTIELERVVPEAEKKRILPIQVK